MSTDVTYFAKTNFRNNYQRFGIKQGDRFMHMYVIGKTGTGKSSLLKTMFLQDIQKGIGVCLIDPHGDLAMEVVQTMEDNRKKDLIYFDVPNTHLKLKYNPFKRVSPEKRSLVASGILDVFKKLWSDAWGVKLEHILRYSILALLDRQEATIADIPKLLLEYAFRKEVIKDIQNPNVRDFWQKEFPNYNRYDLLPVLNKVGGMLAHPAIRRVLIENPEEVFLRDALDKGKIIVVNLAKGHLGEDISHILGALFVSSLNAAAFSRVDTPEDERRPFIIYLDEFHNFTTLSMVTMLSELRKFKIGLTLAHQYLNQLEEDVRRAIFGNIGTIISFRLGSDDAVVLAREMYPVFLKEDFINLANYDIYLRLMIDGIPSKPFSATTLPIKDSL